MLGLPRLGVRAKFIAMQGWRQRIRLGLVARKTRVSSRNFGVSRLSMHSISVSTFRFRFPFPLFTVARLGACHKVHAHAHAVYFQRPIPKIGEGVTMAANSK